LALAAQKGVTGQKLVADPAIVGKQNIRQCGKDRFWCVDHEPFVSKEYANKKPILDLTFEVRRVTDANLIESKEDQEISEEP
jgi:hypothetical protein